MMISVWMYPFALAFSLLGFSLLFIGLAQLYIYKGKKNKIARVFMAVLIVSGLLCQLPIGVQKGIGRLEHLSAKSSQYKDMGKLYEAIDRNRYDDLDKMVKEGADLNADIEGKYQKITPLFLAINNNNYMMVLFLLKNGADINQITAENRGKTPLIVAISGELNKKKCDTGMIRLLLENGADAALEVQSDNSSNSALLEFSQYCNNPDVLKLLLDHKADVNASNGRIVETIISRGMNHYTNQPEDDTIDLVNFIEILMDYGVDFNLKNADGRSSLIQLCYLAQSHDSDIKVTLTALKIVVEHSSDINAVDNDGLSALDYLLANESKRELAHYLMEHGAEQALND